jgi:Zn-dependent peptidase ImmA (M78 family)
MTSSTVTFRRQQTPSTLSQVRRIMPRRPLRFDEAKRVAELQAARLLEAEGHNIGPVGASLIAGLPRIDVQYRHGLLGSGITTWERGAWRIAINADEPRVRQRFTLAHELKHIIDASHEDAIYGHLATGPARQRHIEAVCDHFAACLLMPRRQVKRLWGEGIQDFSALATYFDVSQQAMHIRLQVIGLVDPLPRCIRTVSGMGRAAVRGSQAKRPDASSALTQRNRQSYRRLSAGSPLALHLRPAALAA